MPNPLHLLVPPLLVIFALPLAALATLTTTLAFSTLFFRALVVYLEMALAVIQNYLFESMDPVKLQKERLSSSKPLYQPVAVPSPSDFRSFHHRRKRRSSSGSGTSSTSPVAEARSSPHTTSAKISTFTPNPVDRDFEGIGGWRAPGRAEEEALWASLYSRLELPAGVIGDPPNPRPRRHRRSLTSSSQTSLRSTMPFYDAGAAVHPRGLRRSSDALSISPVRVSSRNARTPPATASRPSWREGSGSRSPEEGYFGIRPSRSHPGMASAAAGMMTEGRKMSGGSTASEGGPSSGKISQLVWKSG
ncbi:MAG: hypothetical protein M1819_005300 [Sarea resinae]|nr:MAG: hypothetical protein M1819_005300 [Sarea resinae]